MKFNDMQVHLNCFRILLLIRKPNPNESTRHICINPGLKSLKGRCGTSLSSAALSAFILAHHHQILWPTCTACVRRMMDYMLANALQQSLLHALAQLLDLLSGTSGLDQSQLHAKSLERLPSTISSMTSLQSGQPQPVLSWQTGPAGAQPLPFIDVQTGMPVAQLQQSRRSTRTASIPANTGAMQPWVDMTLLLSSTGDDLVFRPPVADLVRHFDNVLRDLPNTIAVVQRLLTHPDLEVTTSAA